MRWIDAKEFYTKSIAVIFAKEDKWEKAEDPKAEKALLRKMEELSHINRALCNLELGMCLANDFSIEHDSYLFLTQAITDLALLTAPPLSNLIPQMSRHFTVPRWLY